MHECVSMLNIAALKKFTQRDLACEYYFSASGMQDFQIHGWSVAPPVMNLSAWPQHRVISDGESVGR